MMNDEFPMPKQIRNPNDEGKACQSAGTIWTLVLRHSFGIRHSDFVIFQSLLTSALSILRAGDRAQHPHFATRPA